MADNNLTLTFEVFCNLIFFATDFCNFYIYKYILEFNKIFEDKLAKFYSISSVLAYRYDSVIIVY